jgi:hypothetical protein
MFLYKLDDKKWNCFLHIRRNVFQKTTTNHVFLLGFFGMGCCPKIPLVLAGCKTDNKNTKKLVFILEVN